MAHPAHKQGDCPVIGCSECRRLADETMDQLLNNARTRAWQKLCTQADLAKAVADEREAVIKLLYKHEKLWWEMYQVNHEARMEHFSDAAAQLAEKIEARGKATDKAGG